MVELEDSFVSVHCGQVATPRRAYGLSAQYNGYGERPTSYITLRTVQYTIKRINNHTLIFTVL